MPSPRPAQSDSNPARRAAAVPRGVVIVLCVAVALAGAWFGVRLLRPTVSVTEVVDGPVVQAFYATGTLQPVREYPIRSSVAGFVRQVSSAKPYIDKGDRVAAGVPLARIEDSQLRFLVDKAAAEAEERRRRADEAASPILKEFDDRMSALTELLAIAKREQDRMAKLMETSSASQSDFDKSLNSVKTLWSDLESLKSEKAAMRFQLQRELDVAEAALSIARFNYDLQVLKSPIDGVVLDRPVSLGTRLAINDALFTIADVRPENLVMRAQVDEEDVTQVNLGQKVIMSLYSFAGRPFEGRVTRIYDKADPDRRTFEVDIKLTHPDPKMSPGMTGELAFEVASKPSALIVPSQAVQEGHIYLLRDGAIRAVEATLGIRGVERTEVVSGAARGDRVLISPVAGLHEGQHVREAFVSPQAAADQNKPKAKEIFRGGF